MESVGRSERIVTTEEQLAALVGEMEGVTRLSVVGLDISPALGLFSSLVHLDLRNVTVGESRELRLVDVPSLKTCSISDSGDIDTFHLENAPRLKELSMVDNDMSSVVVSGCARLEKWTCRQEFPMVRLDQVGSRKLVLFDCVFPSRRRYRTSVIVLTESMWLDPKFVLLKSPDERSAGGAQWRTLLSLPTQDGPEKVVESNQFWASVREFYKLKQKYCLASRTKLRKITTQGKAEDTGIRACVSCNAQIPEGNKIEQTIENGRAVLRIKCSDPEKERKKLNNRPCPLNMTVTMPVTEEPDEFAARVQQAGRRKRVAGAIELWEQAFGSSEPVAKKLRQFRRANEADDKLIAARSARRLEATAFRAKLDAFVGLVGEAIDAKAAKIAEWTRRALDPSAPEAEKEHARAQVDILDEEIFSLRLSLAARSSGPRHFDPDDGIRVDPLVLTPTDENQFK